MKSATIGIAALLLSCPLTVPAGVTKTVTVDSCPSRLSFTAPDGFTPASTVSQAERRDAIINTLHSNPNRRARYSEILLADWSSDANIPYVAVYSLGSVRSRQGRIAPLDWEKIRGEALTATREGQETWVQAGLMRLGNSEARNRLSATIDKVSSGTPNEVTIFGVSSWESMGRPQRVNVASKLIYVRNCVASVSITLDASAPNSFEQLVRLAAETKLQ